MSEAVVETLLPKAGVGYLGYKSDATRYGTESTVRFITQLAIRWSQVHAQGPRLQIGDLSPKGGGPCPNGGKDKNGLPTYHKSHRGGRDFDVQIIRGDGKEGVRTVRISDPSTHAPTQELVTLIHDLARANLKLILTAGTAYLRGAKVVLDVDHTYHLHVRLLS
jgi:murein endopeptidase